MHILFGCKYTKGNNLCHYKQQFILNQTFKNTLIVLLKHTILTGIFLFFRCNLPYKGTRCQELDIHFFMIQINTRQSMEHFGTHFMVCVYIVIPLKNDLPVPMVSINIGLVGT